MDKSKIYIKMCDCEEIQNQCPFTEGDFIFNKSANNGTGHLFINYLYQPKKESNEWVLIYRDDEKKDFNIWLPRQDQLQKITKSDWSIHFSSIHGFMVTFDDPDFEYKTMAKTSEQAFLQFVMLKLYNKKWDGETWTKK